MVPILKMRQLRAALAVRELGSAVKAAGKVNLSPPAVLGAISALEKTLQETLFERTPQGMPPTAAGVAFCRRIAAGMEHLKAASAEIRPHHPFADQISNVHIRTLAALLEVNGFSTAARHLGFSQSSIHRTARELEDLVGCVLWQRQGKMIQPTLEARRLGYHVDLLMTELRMGVDEINELKAQMTGRLVVGASPLARSKWLPRALALTLARFPEVNVSVINTSHAAQLDALQHGYIDVMLGPLQFPAPSADIEQELLFEDSLSIVVRAAHPLAAGFDSHLDRVSSADLQKLSWILPPHTSPPRTNFEAFMASKGLAPPTRVIECISPITILALLLETDHAAILSARQIEYELALHQLKILGPPLAGSTQPVGMIFRAGFRPTKLCEIFLEDVRTAAAELIRPDRRESASPGG